MLHENQEKAERLQAELPRRVKNKDMLFFHHEEQDQLLQAEGKAQLAKPDGWINVVAKPARRAPSTVRWLEEERCDDLGLDDSPLARRRHGSGRGYGEGLGRSLVPWAFLRTSREIFRLNHRQPESDCQTGRGTNQVERRLLPTASPALSLARRARWTWLAEVLAHPGLPLQKRKRFLLPVQLMLKVIWILACRLKHLCVGRCKMHRFRKSLPRWQGQNLMGAALNGLGRDVAPEITKRPARGRTGRKRQPKADREVERPLQLQVEASALRRDPGPEDSQGSGSEREHASSASPHPVVKDVAAERRGLLSKLSKRMKSVENASAKDMY
eukprot:g11379.t1